MLDRWDSGANHARAGGAEAKPIRKERSGKLAGGRNRTHIHRSRVCCPTIRRPPAFGGGAGYRRPERGQGERPRARSAGRRFLRHELAPSARRARGTRRGRGFPSLRRWGRDRGAGDRDAAGLRERHHFQVVLCQQSIEEWLQPRLRKWIRLRQRRDEVVERGGDRWCQVFGGAGRIDRLPFEEERGRLLELEERARALAEQHRDLLERSREPQSQRCARKRGSTRSAIWAGVRFFRCSAFTQRNFSGLNTPAVWPQSTQSNFATSSSIVKISWSPDDQPSRAR